MVNFRPEIVSYKMGYHFKKSGSEFLLKRNCEVNAMGENNSFMSICYVKTVSVYDFKLVCVFPHPSVKESFKTIC